MRSVLKMKKSDELLHIDIQVDENKARTSVLDLLRTLRPNWRPEDIHMKTFTEGITNQLLGCSVDESDCVLVRVYGQRTELFLDRQREVEMFRLLHANGCGPQIYCSFRNGICYQFVPGDVLEDELLCQPSIYRLIAAEMARIHSIRPPSAHPPERVLWTKLSRLLTLVEDSGEFTGQSSTSGPQLPGLARLSMEAETLERQLSPLGSPTVLCHNDLLTKNIIYDRQQETVRFIDYEYAEYNYQAFDIGNHFNEFAGVQDIDYGCYPSRRLQSDWLEAYLLSYKHCTGQDVVVARDEVTQLYVQVCKFSLASHFFWGLWAILQSHYSSIDFDFRRYAMARLNRYFEKKEEYFLLK
ncbi:ethanolamine kinase 1-like isoform X1 [Phycodurus eques]|uniref:ethanolamine kinase 1-like isoform X1 n=1 Tax=Phycodurus eques TaxID=693459 RepID=UPI002ACD479B|nr:ethanolamine kinase 1-like isoform X1 [Phycodurus eques]